MKKSFAVIGLGKFGLGVVHALTEARQEVMVVDSHEENLKEVADLVTYALQADVTEKGVLDSLGLSNMDVVVVAMAESMEASILVAMYAKDAGVPHVVAKAMNKLHGEILEKVGADEVVYPEYSMGSRLAKSLVSGGFSDMFELSPTFSMVEFPIPDHWVGKNLMELRLRERLNVNVVGLREQDGLHVSVNIQPGDSLPAGATLIVVGENDDLRQIFDRKE